MNESPDAGVTSDARRHFVFILGSARRDGNTEALARYAAAAIGNGDEQSWLRLHELALPPFDDIRHSIGTYPYPTGDAARLLEATLAATDLIIAAPLYWYSVPASVKLYLDHWSGWMRVAQADFKPKMAGKRLWAICAISDDDESVAEPFVRMLELTAGYLRMSWRGTLFGVGNRPGDVEQDAPAIARAGQFFR